jgi:hypothetical protein
LNQNMIARAAPVEVAKPSFCPQNSTPSKMIQNYALPLAVLLFLRSRGARAAAEDSDDAVMLLLALDQNSITAKEAQELLYIDGRGMVCWRPGRGNGWKHRCTGPVTPTSTPTGRGFAWN